MKTKAIQIMETGGPDVMRLVDIDVPPPGKGEIQLRQTAIGLNYIDTYHRSGLYTLPLPAGIGMEAAGIVEAVGEGVKGFKPGDRAAYGLGPRGAYAFVRNIPAVRAVKLPKAIGDETAAASRCRSDGRSGIQKRFPIARDFPGGSRYGLSFRM